MTRFMEELKGLRGSFWQKEAEKELEKVKAELNEGKITVDENGVARNCIGRVLMSDMLEKVALISDKVSVEATTLARDEVVHKELEEYKRSRKGYSQEELKEMRATFGKGTTIRDIITGEEITL